MALYPAGYGLPPCSNKLDPLGLERDHSSPYVQQNYLLESPLWTPPMIGSGLWDGLNTMHCNFEPEESENMDTRTGRPCMNKYAKDQTTCQIPSEFQEFASQSCSIIPCTEEISPGLTHNGPTKLTSQPTIYRRILPQPSDITLPVKLTNCSPKPARETENSEIVKWDHTASSELRRRSCSTGLKVQRKTGRRNGRPGPAATKKVHVIGEMSVCWRCRLSKISVSQTDAVY